MERIIKIEDKKWPEVSTDVFHLTICRKYTFPLPPKQAVIAAYQYYRGKFCICDKGFFDIEVEETDGYYRKEHFVAHKDGSPIKGIKGEDFFNDFFTITSND